MDIVTLPSPSIAAPMSIHFHPHIEGCRVSTYTVPTDRPESDGTLKWNATTLVLVEVTADGQTGMGYTYCSPAVAALIDHQLRPVVLNAHPMHIEAAYRAMIRETRNLGRPGIVSMAISAVDVALWDLKAKLLRVSLSLLLGQVREAVPVYGSGGFTSYTDDELRRQTSDWIAAGMSRVKIKVGREPDRDGHRVTVVRNAIGDAELFVDANGAYGRKQAIAMAEQFLDLGVVWFEEPVPSDDLRGLRLVRDADLAPMEVTAGEYGFQPSYFRRMLAAGSVDVLQADATRCGGLTGFLAVAALSDAYRIPLSSHCAPALHAHIGCALPIVRHVEYFHDHVRIERLFFDGFPEPQAGAMRPALDRPGLGLEFKAADANPFSN